MAKARRTPVAAAGVYNVHSSTQYYVVRRSSSSCSAPIISKIISDLRYQHCYFYSTVASLYQYTIVCILYVRGNYIAAI